MSYLISNIPQFKCWVRKEFTANHSNYHEEYLHALVIAVNTIPDRSLSFQVVFTGCEIDNPESGIDQNIHGGAMWARMPIQALVADIELEEWPDRMEDHLVQPWDCESRSHSAVIFDRVSSSPWLAKINHDFFEARYMFTVDYTEHEIADSPDQHKQSHETTWRKSVQCIRDESKSTFCLNSGHVVCNGAVHYSKSISKPKIFNLCSHFRPSMRALTARERRRSRR